MLLSNKSKGYKSNVRISWMYRYRFYDLKVHFWWPNKRLFSYNQRWNTLYNFAFEKSPDYLSLKHWSSLAIQRERYGSMIFEFGRLRVQHNNIFFLHTKKWSKKWTRLPKLFVVLIWYQKSTLELQIYLSVTAECVRALKAFFLSNTKSTYCLSSMHVFQEHNQAFEESSCYA